MSQDPFLRNAILGQLPEGEYAQLKPHLRLDQARGCYQPGSILRYPRYIRWWRAATGSWPLKWPPSAMKALWGFGCIWGAASSLQTAFCQVPGGTGVVSVDEFRRALSRRDGALRGLLSRCTQVAMVQISQNDVVCKRSYSAEKRMVRWLLTIQDRRHPRRVSADPRVPCSDVGRASTHRVRHRPKVPIRRPDPLSPRRHHRHRLRSIRRTRVCCYGIVKAEFDGITIIRNQQASVRQSMARLDGIFTRDRCSRL